MNFISMAFRFFQQIRLSPSHFTCFFLKFLWCVFVGGHSCVFHRVFSFFPRMFLLFLLHEYPLFSQCYHTFSCVPYFLNAAVFSCVHLSLHPIATISSDSQRERKRSMSNIEQDCVTFRIRDDEANELHFKVSMGIRLQKVFDVYASKKTLTVSALKFLFDGQRLVGDMTPESLGMPR